MALIKVNMNSTTFNMGTSLYVVAPQYGVAQSRGGTDNPGPYKVLYLLHGHGGDFTEWLRNTNLERYVNAYPVVVVLPSGDNSWYSNLQNGMRYQDYLTKELPELIGKWFPISKDPKDHYIGGISMGGYGTLRTVLNNPGLFGKAFGISSVTDIAPMYEREGGKDRTEFIFGDLETAKESGAELYAQLDRLAAAGEKLPPIYLTGGTEDRLFPQSEKMAKALADKGYDVTFEPQEGVHDWAFGDKGIQSALKWLFDDKEGK